MDSKPNEEERLKLYKRWEANEEIQLFRDYLRYPTVHPNIDYEPCIEFLIKLGNDLGLEVNVERPSVMTKPTVIMSMIGEQPELPSIILNSHMDVVPVFEEYWTQKPFDAFMDLNGKIFARGAQDMKCVGTQYLGALRSFKRNLVTFKRTIHVLFVPEEELGGVGGMADLINTEAFKTLNAGFSLDEGIASPTESFDVYYAERSIWHTIFKIKGTSGSDSSVSLISDTAGEKLRKFLDKIYEYRATQVAKLKSDSKLSIGDVTTVNVTMVDSGEKSKMTPREIKVMTDFRLAVEVDHDEFEEMINNWCAYAGGDIDYEFDYKDPFIAPTKTDETNQFWTALQSAFVDLNIKTQVKVFPGGTDARFLRSVGIPAIGFSPMNNTPILLHDNDEYLEADTYLKGIKIYEKIIEKVANV